MSQALIGKAATESITNVFFFCHGWQGDLPGAKDQYTKWLKAFMNSADRQQASQRFDPRDIEFRRVEAEDNPGPRDSIHGVFDVHRRNGRDEAFRFNCSVDFREGRVFNAEFMPLRDDRRYDDQRR